MSEILSRLKEISAQEQALAEEKKKLLEESRQEDLSLVRELCERHGFTATDLKGTLKMRGRGRPPAAVKPKRDPNAPKRKYTRRAKSAA
jgi:DNA-binding protein H-NS